MSKPFKQIIKIVQGSTALVESKKGNIYPVVISDQVRLSNKSINVGDYAIIRRVGLGKYYMIDVEAKKTLHTHTNELNPKDIGYDY